MPTSPHTLARHCAPLDLRTAPMVYPKEAPPTVENVNAGLDILRAEGLHITACNGNCSQGRMCDCVPDLDDTADAEKQIPGAGAVVVPVICLLLFMLGIAVFAR